jgi:hypothetical protein
MEERSITSRLIVSLVAATFAACSSQSPVAPSPLSAVGGRISYEPQGSGIAAGMTIPENFTWVEAS